jgi:cytochrome c oxidase subunit II
MKKIFFLFSIIFFTQITGADYPRPWQINFQEPVTPVMESIYHLHNMLMYVMTAVVIFVVALLAYVCYRFSAKRNPVPNKFSHNVVVEVIWTIIPVIILIVIAIPSFRALYFAEKVQNAEMTVKVVGYQWYWHYQYPDHGNFEYDSYMIGDKDLKENQIRFLEVDNRIVIPVNTNVRFLITAGDVIHSFAMPAFGVKTDAVPGRVNETWVNVKKPGVYYGQCSELCGVNHAFMPIAIEVVAKDEFEEWIKKSQEKFK